MTDLMYLVLDNWHRIILWAAIFDIFVTAPAYFLLWKYVIKPKATGGPNAETELIRNRLME